MHVVSHTCCISLSAHLRVTRAQTHRARLNESELCRSLGYIHLLTATTCRWVRYSLSPMQIGACSRPLITYDGYNWCTRARSQPSFRSDMQIKASVSAISFIAHKNYFTFSGFFCGYCPFCKNYLSNIFLNKIRNKNMHQFHCGDFNGNVKI